MMKRIFFFLVFLFSLTAHAGEAINFVEGDWDAIRAKAKAENKYIFLDSYTDWCYWCKVMDKKTFPDKAVSTLINTQFIPIRRDMERGEGKQLCMKFHVSGFPTYLVFSPQGELVYTIVGFREPADFVSELNKAMQPANHQLRPGLSAALDPGYPQFYKDAFGPSKERKPATETDINTFLDTQKDLMTEVAWSVMWRFPMADNYENYLIRNQAEYAKRYGKELVDERVKQLLMGRVKEAAQAKDEAAFLRIVAQADSAYPDDKSITFNFKATFYSEVKMWDKFVAAYEDYTNGNAAPAITNWISWTLFEECEDQAILTKAVGWMKEASTKEPSYAIIDTYASLLYKTGNLNEAEVQAKRAIAQGKKEGEGTDATKELLEKIKAAKAKKN